MRTYGAPGALETAAKGFAAISLILIAASCGGASHEEAPQGISAEQAASAYPVERIAAPDYKPVSAILTNRDVGAARARIGGTLVELMVREGDEVEKGAAVGLVTDQRRVLEVKAASEAVSAAQAQNARAQSDYARVKELFEKGVYAQARLDASEAEAKSAEAQLRAARAQRDAIRETTEQGEVLAPASGRVTSAPIPEGAVVMAGEIIAKIATGQRVLRIEMPESEARSINEGDDIIVIANGARDRAAILQIYPAVDNGLVVIDVEATGFNDEFVGIRTPVLVPVGTRDAIFVPKQFIKTRYGVDYVRLLRADGGVIDAPVQLGDIGPAAAEGDDIEVLTGLNPGDRILPFEAPSNADAE